jgi:hypothetical protein
VQPKEVLGALERLGEEVDGAVLHGAHRFLHRPERGEDDHVHVRGDGLGLFQELETGEAGHLEVGEKQVDAALAQPVERGLPVGSQHHSVAFAGQRPLETLAHRGIVVRHQQHGLVSHPGSS